MFTVVVKFSLGQLPMDVVEDIGQLPVCVTLITANNTDRETSVYLSTKPYTAKGKLQNSCVFNTKLIFSFTCHI